MRVTQGHLCYTYRKSACKIYTVVWSADGGSIACSVSDGTVTIVDAETGRLRTCLQTETGGTTVLALAPHGPQVASSSQGQVVVWQYVTGERIFSYSHSSEEGSIQACSWSPDGTCLASSGYEDVPTVQVRDMTTGSQLATFVPHEPFDEEQWELAQAGLPFDHPPLYPICWSAQGNFLALGQHYKVHIWQPSTQERLFSHCGTVTKSSGDVPAEVDRLAWSADERFLAVAYNHVIEVWDWRRNQRTAVYSGHNSYIHAIVWLPEGNRIISTSRKQLHLWDAATGTCLGTSTISLAQEEEYVFYDASLSPDRSKVALAGMQYVQDEETEGLIWVWSHGLEM